MKIVRSIFAYDPSGWRPLGALLRALGVALSAVGGEAVGGHGAAVLAGVGALYAGIASFGGVHQARLRRMLAAIAAASAATLLGSLVQPSDLLTIATVTLVSLFLGVLAAVGPDAAQVALLTTGTLVVFSGLHGASAHPVLNALLVLGGGVGQALILMAVHPISPVAAERRAVEAVYAGMAVFCRDRSRGRSEIQLPHVATAANARDLLRAAFRYGGRPELDKLWAELELSDALRANLAGLDRARPPTEVWTDLQGWFEAAAQAVGHGKALQRSLPTFNPQLNAAPWLARMQRTVAASETGALPPSLPVSMSWSKALWQVATLREIVLGHALRYAVALGVATAAYRLPEVDHGYWAPLSLAFSLRPDFAGTITRGLGRIVGTAFGVALATVFITFGHPGDGLLTVAMLLAAWIAFAFQSASYIGYSTALAFYVVDSVVLAGASARTIGIERVAATAAGSLLALVAAFAWPRWEAGKARQSLAVAFAAQAEYADAVTAFTSREAVAHARLQARAARLEAERIVGSAELEPPWTRAHHLQGANAALARLAENAARILAAHVTALDPHDDDPSEDLTRLAQEARGRLPT